jgi:hypothetical protein
VKRGAGLSSVAEHHVEPGFDTIAAQKPCCGNDLFNGRLLIDSSEDLRRPRFDAKTHPFATRESHLAYEFFGKNVYACVTAPQKANPAFANPSAKFKNTSTVCRKGVVFDEQNLDRQLRQGTFNIVKDTFEP